MTEGNWNFYMDQFSWARNVSKKIILHKAPNLQKNTKMRCCFWYSGIQLWQGVTEKKNEPDIFISSDFWCFLQLLFFLGPAASS